MKICSAQTKPIRGDIQKNVEQHLALINQAIKHKAEFIVFPELSITGYEPTLTDELATIPDDERFDVFQSKSDKNDIVISIGAPIKNDGGVSIGMITFRPKKPRKLYLKKHLFHTELKHFVTGNTETNIEIKNTTIGLAICYEISVPEHQKVAFENGSEIYVAGIVETVEGIERAIDKMATTSKKYAMVSLIANCIGVSGKYDCGGKSSIWDANGDLQGQLSGTEIGVLIYDTDSKEVDIDYLQ
ncbi:MAG: carbon-nitrogen hydrolase family protein [Crocinitomicaceae bacterium]|nr:carbon-nitrogen hydrolase family protein [Crocinitomicaceae bacterium]